MANDDQTAFEAWTRLLDIIRICDSEIEEFNGLSPVIAEALTKPAEQSINTELLDNVINLLACVKHGGASKADIECAERVTQRAEQKGTKHG